MSNNRKPTETHPHLPSGKWQGFYSYQYGPNSTKHEMRFRLTFCNSKISGRGSDDVGHFTWEGNYDIQSLTVTITKYYPSHEVNYKGWIDENGIWGNWTIGAIKGGFHIWPKESYQKEEALAENKRMEAYQSDLQKLMNLLKKRS